MNTLLDEKKMVALETVQKGIQLRGDSICYEEFEMCDCTGQCYGDCQGDCDRTCDDQCQGQDSGDSCLVYFNR